MSKYKLIGDYTIHDVIAEKIDDSVTARIPFVSENGSLQYGIDKVFRDLRKKSIFPSENGIDILSLAALVYLADTRISRSRHSEDSWVREITIELPVINLAKWLSLEGVFSKMLNFLTGDRWTIRFSQRDISLAEEIAQGTGFDVVSLFSGGMDSLIGAINHLENNNRVAFISHAGDGFTKDAQKSLIAEFNNQYTDNAPSYFSLWMSFGKDILLDGGIENTTRSRSFLFIAFGIFAISGMNRVNVLQVPENGLIALNVPLENLRLGAHSTRTTHPYYMNLWNSILSDLGFQCSVENPYWNKTKGEMAVECLNKGFLQNVIKKSTSCSSPQKARWSGLPSQHCGYCVPCLIRRAAMHKAFGFENDGTTYSRTSIEELINAHAKRKGEQLRSFQVAIKRIKDNPSLKGLFIYKGGKLDGNDDYIRQLSEVYQRGLLEVDGFINAYLQHENNATG